MDWLKNRFFECSMLAVLGLAATTHATLKTTCPLDVRPILTKIGPAPLDNSPIGSYPLRVWDAHQNLAKAIYSRFTKGQITSEQIGAFSHCLQAPLNDADLSLALNTEFLNGSLSRVRNINPAAYDRISKKYPVESMVFQIFDGHANQQKLAEKAIGSRQAGFHISTQSLFMNIAQISSNDWDAIFIHEMGHFIAPVSSDVQFFNDQKIIEKVAALVGQYNHVGSLAESEIQLIDQWLYHGINIRLLAEWRVWNFTIEFLQGQKNIALGPRTLWLKPYLSSTLSELERKRELFLVLDKNFYNPSEGIFSNTMIQERLISLRDKLRYQAINGNL